MLSNMPFPVPWRLIPTNIAFMVLYIFILIVSPSRRKLDAARHAAGLQGSFLHSMNEGARACIHAWIPEMEYPHVALERTISVGPIFKHVPPVSSSTYPELTRFLDEGRTVLVNLGSIFQYTNDDVEAIASAISLAREKLQDRLVLRILWKLPRAETFQRILDKHLEEIRKDVYIQEWIDAPSLAILQHPNIVAHVHHGGASEFHLFFLSSFVNDVD
jgi:hypothetical protein